MGAGAPWLALAAVALLLPLAGRDAGRRAWALLTLAATALFILARVLPAVLVGASTAPAVPAIGGPWDWAGALCALAALLAVLRTLRQRGLIAPADLGLTLRQAPGALRPALAASAVMLALQVALTRALPAGPPVAVGLETWFYLATLPGLVEEVCFRGLLLACADRASPPQARIAGARIGVGGLLVTAAFVALHGAAPAGLLLGVLPAALLYLWLRARTGSLLLPIVVHNLWNLAALAARP